MSASVRVWLLSMAPRLAAPTAGGGWGGGHWHGGGWWWLLWWLAVVGVSVAFVAAVVWLLRHQSGPGSGWRHARRILAERYARGELTTEEYRARLEEVERTADDW